MHQLPRVSGPHKSFVLAGLMAALAIALPVFAADGEQLEEGKITEETPYVQSPKIVVDTMLEMAGV